MTLDKFYLPPFCNDFLSLKSGLVLIAGPSGSGRSTMMTTFGETIAASRPVYMQTIEKPIERLLKNAGTQQVGVLNLGIGGNCVLKN